LNFHKYLFHLAQAKRGCVTTRVDSFPSDGISIETNEKEQCMFRTALTIVSASFGLIIGLGVGAAFGTIVSLSGYFFHGFNEALWKEGILYAQRKIPRLRISFSEEDDGQGVELGAKAPPSWCESGSEK